MTAVAKSVCVYCGARSGTRPAYAEDARATGRMIARNGWQLVYGAGDVGLMGEVARAAQAEGARTFGVTPGHLVSLEVGKRDLSTYVVTETMHERKKVMFMNADAIVVLPGGGGSLDEFFEVLTWRQLGLHGKPIFIVNTAGYWDPLLALIARIISEGFADPSLSEFVTVTDNAAALEEPLRSALAGQAGGASSGRA